MKEIRIDHDLHMVIEPPRDSGMNHLRFLRFKAERGDFGPKPLSVPRGDNVFRLTSPEIKAYAMIQGDQELPPQTARERHMAEMGGD